MNKTVLPILLALALTGCGPTSQPTTIQPPTATSPNQKLILGLDAVLVLCEGVGPNTSPPVFAWIIPGCPNAVESIISALQANGTAAQAQVAITGIQTFLANAPKTGLSTQDTQIIQSILGATQAFLIIYQQQTVAMVDYLPSHGLAFTEKTLHGVTLTTAEKDKLKEIRKRAEALRKKVKK